jgi:peptidoglycan/LPS O-acetylase OafA/YrhL
VYVNTPESPDKPSVPAAPREAALDGLRGVAIALVLWHHFVEQSLPPGRASWLGWLRAGTGLSWCGVDLFFTLSGFLIGGILIDKRDSPRFARIFYLRRAARILPLYYVTLAVVGLSLTLRIPGSFHLFPPWVYALFLTNFAIGFSGIWDWLPLSVLWSVAVEEQFYLSAPWVVRLLRPGRLPWVLAGIVAFAEAARVAFVIASPTGHFFPFVLPPFRVDGLALGFLAAWAARCDATIPFRAFLGKRWPVLAGCGAGAVGALALLRPAEGAPSLNCFGYLAIAALFSLIVFVVSVPKPPTLTHILEFRPLVHLGRHSYFIYLWHGLIGSSIIRGLGGSDFSLNSAAGIGIVAIAVGATWLAASGSWKWFEGPVVAWGHRHRY